MKTFKYIFSMLFLLSVIAGCKKEAFDDTSFLNTDTAPDSLSAQFDITQDNSGLVTITPNGQGAIIYDIFFGDTTKASVKLDAGKNVQHTYPEGVYNVKLIAYSITGKSKEVTKQLTVSFKAPENLQVTAVIDAANSFKVNVSATALNETNFKVYFGDVVNEIPTSFLEGETVSHTYTNVGNYTVRIVALSGGAATAQVTKLISIVDPILLPVTFELPSVKYVFNNFGGGSVSVISNPKKTGINTSAKVGKMIKSAGEVYGGSFITLGAPIDFSTNKIFKMKVYSPRVGAKVLLKVENAANTSLSYEKEVASTLANTWEDLTFDFSAVNTANSYEHIVLIFDLGTMGNGTAAFTWLFDDIRLTSPPPPLVSLPLTFESTTTTFNFTDFGGGNVTVINNPNVVGINNSTRVGKMVKNAGEVYGGSFLTLDGPMDFSTNKTFKMKVYSPRVGAKVLLKVENATDASKNYEKEVTTTVANSWEDLTFDYSAINTANSYEKIVLIFELGTMGDGSANFTFLFDDIRLTSGVGPSGVALPLDFESATLTYAFTDFNGGAVTIINNPNSGGINTSAKVGKMVKNAGEVWGGSWIALANPIDFSTKKTLKVKVFSPRIGAKLLVKVENMTNGALSYEKEVATTTANTWEDLTFDYSGINTANSYQKIVLIFDLGTMGDGSANFTFLFDDIRQIN